MKSISEPTTRTLHVPGAVLTYDVRSRNDSNERTLLLVGWPMGASGFAALAYLIRPYQVMRSRRLNVPTGQNQPRTNV